MWIVQHPNGEYINRILWRGNVRLTSLLQCAKLYQRKTARQIVNANPGLRMINVNTGKVYQKESEGE